MRASFRWLLIAVFCSSLGGDAARAGWHHRRALRAAPAMVWQPAGVSECGGWPVPVIESIQPLEVAFDEPCCESVVECCLVESAPIEADAGCCCGESPEAIVADEFLGEVVTSTESGDGLPVIGDDAVLTASPADILPTVREEEVPDVEPVGELVPAGEAGSSVLVEQSASPKPPVVREPATEPVVHEPLRMDATPAEPEAGAEPIAPEQAPPEAEPEPVNIFEAEEGAEASLEPTRRWIHARGDRSLVARLVGLPDADTCLLEAAGRRIRVSLDSLSQHDRVYVQRTSERLAAAQATAEPRDTAGL